MFGTGVVEVVILVAAVAAVVAVVVKRRVLVRRGQPRCSLSDDALRHSSGLRHDAADPQRVIQEVEERIRALKSGIGMAASARRTVEEGLYRCSENVKFRDLESARASRSGKWVANAFEDVELTRKKRQEAKLVLDRELETIDRETSEAVDSLEKLQEEAQSILVSGELSDAGLEKEAERRLQGIDQALDAMSDTLQLHLKKAKTRTRELEEENERSVMMDDLPTSGVH